MSRIIYSEPVLSLVKELRAEAETLRDVRPDDEYAALLERTAERIGAAVTKASEAEYVDSAAAAEFFAISEEGVRARCRRSLASKGLARKRGGHWEIHKSVLAA